MRLNLDTIDNIYKNINSTFVASLQCVPAKVFYDLTILVGFFCAYKNKLIFYCDLLVC